MMQSVGKALKNALLFAKSVVSGILVTIGVCSVALLGIRHQRGLPVLPQNLLSAPVDAPPAALAEAPASTAKPDASKAAAVSGGASEQKWNDVLKVTIDSARPVASVYDLMLEDSTLTPEKRKNLEQTRDEMAKLHGEPIVGQMMQVGGQTGPLLVCRVSVKYLGRRETTLHPALADGFQLISANREIFPHLNAGWFSGLMGGMRHVKFPEGKILPGGTVSGDMVFHAKPDTQPAEIRCHVFNID